MTEYPLITAWRKYLARKKAAGWPEGMALTGCAELEPPPMPNRPLTPEEIAFIYPKGQT